MPMICTGWWGSPVLSDKASSPLLWGRDIEGVAAAGLKLIEQTVKSMQKPEPWYLVRKTPSLPSLTRGEDESSTFTLTSV